MKTKLVSLGIVLLCAHVTLAQPKTGREDAGLVGAVCSVRVEMVAGDYSSQSTEGARWLVMTLAFDERGNVIGQSVFRPDGTPKSKLGWANLYHADGRVKERTYYNANGRLTSRAVATYDNSNRLTNQTFYAPNGRINHTEEYNYDVRGNMIREDHKNPDGSPRMSRVFSFDANGRLVDETLFSRDGQVHHRNAYAYDGQGRKAGWTIFESGGSSLIGTSHTYDEKGDVAESRYYTKGKLSHIETFTYKYDEKGNWIERETRRETTVEGKPQSARETNFRTIVYY